MAYAYSGSAGGIEQGENLGNQQSVSTSEEGEIANVESIETSMPVTTALASAGNTLEGSQSELLLQPLRLAFDTKNAKLLESALDCLHVRCLWYVNITTSHWLNDLYLSVHIVNCYFFPANAIFLFINELKVENRKANIT